MSTTSSSAASRLRVREVEQEQAGEVLAYAGPLDTWTLRTETGTVELPPELTKVLRTVLVHLTIGSELVLQPLPKELTTTLAASVLGMSRPTLMRYVEAGEIPTHKVGTHTRFRLEDVRAFDRMLRKRSRAAFDELRALEHSLGLYEDD
jgi:excisionase family DNA binding protein